MVTLTAEPSGDSEFTGWSGDVGGTINPLTIVMNGNKSITAVFTDSNFTNYLPSILGE
jgi:hypothetical protein